MAVGTNAGGALPSTEPMAATARASSWSRLRAYAAAVAISAVAIALSRLPGVPIGENAFPLLLPAVMVSAWYGGVGPALLATGLGAASGTLFSLSEVHSSPGPTARGIVPLGVFLVDALVICGLSVSLRSAQRRAAS